MMKKYISPGGWFSLELPPGWSEFEDTEESFLFYNPDNWCGNFRISAYKDSSPDYGKQSIAYELKHNPTSVPVKVGTWDCAYSTETFQEEGAWYTTHIWVTGSGDLSFECSFTVPRGEDRTTAEGIIRTLAIRKTGAPKEIIPIRVLEIGILNMAYDWASTNVKKTLNKDFTAQESDIERLQQLVDGNRFKIDQRQAWESIGLALGVIIENEMDGMEWVSVIDGTHEYPALRFRNTKLVVPPAYLIWGKVKRKEPVNLRTEYEKIRADAEKLLNA